MASLLRQLTIPNLLSLLRIAAVPFIVIAIVEGRFLVALVLFVAAGVTDVLDGWLARRYGWSTKLGAFLDPAGDKLLLVALYVTLAFPEVPAAFHFPVWLTVLVLSRDVLIVAIALTLFVAIEIKSFPPSPYGKAATFVLILDGGVALLANVVPLPDTVTVGVIWTAAAVTLVSGFDYVFRAAQLASREEQDGRGGEGT